MSNQLGWVQFSKALDRRRAGASGAGGSGWGDDERPARVTRRDPGMTGHVLRRVFRPGRTLMVIALVVLTIASWAVKASATPQSLALAPAGSTATGGSPGLIAAGESHTCVVLAGGTVSCWGDNTSGQLGTVTAETYSVAPVSVDGLTDVVAVSAGDAHSCALLASRSIRCWGRGFSGQLGDGTTSSSTTPVDVLGIGDAVAVSAGGDHTCALRVTGLVNCWGDNNDGGLGDGTTTEAPSPVEVVGIANAVAIAAGTESSCAVLETGAARCWGFNGNGQLGNGTEVDSHVPVDVVALGDAVSIGMGQNHSCAIRSGGSAMCWGNNSSGELGNGTLSRSSVPVAVVGLTDAVTADPGDFGTCAMSASGAVSCWGNSFRGTVGNGVSDGSVFTIPVPVTGVNDAVSLAAGSEHGCVIRVDASVWCWGDSSDGEAGAGLPSEILEPLVIDGVGAAVHVATGRDYTCAHLVDATVSCWGAGSRGQLGNGGNPTSAEPSTVSGLTDVTDVTAGDFHACAVLADTTMRCWGSNSAGELGDGTRTESTTPVVVGLSAVAEAGAGGEHTCARLEDGTMSCWGDGFPGQLGNGSTTDQLVPTIVAGANNIAVIAVGGDRTCARGESGPVACWGENGDGQLGDGTTTDRTTPTLVSTVPNSFVTLDAGTRHTCAARAAATMCWGDNISGQLGDGTSFDRLTPVAVSGIAGSQVRAGGSHTCGIVTGGAVKCWGQNFHGQLGDGSLFQRSTPVDVVGIAGVSDLDLGDRHTCVVLADATVACWGSNLEGQIGKPSSFPVPVQTAVGGAAVPQIAIPLSPARLLDTRSANSTVDGLFAGGGRRGAGSVLELVVSGRGGVPVGAAAVVVNVTVVDPLEAGFVTVSPCGSPVPVASSLNFGPGDVVPNELVAKVGANGSICVFTDAETHVLADVVGYLPAGPGYAPLSPARLLDTRSANSTVDGLFAGGGRRGAGSVLELVVSGRGGVPVGAAAVVVNVTVVDPLEAGFVTVSPCGSPVPVASSLNFGPGDVVPNELVAKVGANGSICVFTDAETHVLADVVGYLPAGPGYAPLSPARLLDTRSANSTVDGLFAGGGRRGAGSVLELVVSGRGGVPVGAAAVVVNVTVVDPLEAGFVTVSPCGSPVPVASSLNFGPGDVVPNELVAKVGATNSGVEGSICVFTDAETHVLADVVGYLP